jgi:cytochrome P450
MTVTTILDPSQLVDRTPARSVDEIVAKLFLRAWQGQTQPQPLGRMQMVSDPVEAVDLLSRPDAFAKCYSFLSQLGRSRFDTDGDDWAGRRDLTQPLYREAARTANRAVLDAAYSRWLTDDALQSGGIERALLAASAEVFLHALGGQSDTGPIADWLISLRSTAILAQHLAMFDPDPTQFAELQRRVAELRGQLRAMLVTDHRLMQHLGARLDPFDQTFDLLGEVTLNLFAGTETTVASICWALGILARRPEVLKRVATDLQRSGPDARSLTHFIQEAMRYCPPVPLLVRIVTNPDETLAGRSVPQGQMIALSIVGLHHNRQLWSQPDRFDARRAAFVDNTYHRRAYLPFSAGPRVCGGIGLARAEIAIALSHVLTRYRIVPVKTPIRYEYSLTLRPLGTSRLRFEKR